METLYKAFGGRLQTFRRAAHLNQETLAVRVGLRRTSITNIEAGRQHVSLHQVYLLAAALGKQPQEMLPDLDAGIHTDLVRDVQAVGGDLAESFFRRALDPAGSNDSRERVPG